MAYYSGMRTVTCVPPAIYSTRAWPPSAAARSLIDRGLKHGGRASFAVAGGRAFTIEQRGGNEVVAAYDVTTGRELWTNAWKERFSQWMGGGEGF